MSIQPVLAGYDTNGDLVPIEEALSKQQGLISPGPDSGWARRRQLLADADNQKQSITFMIGDGEVAELRIPKTITIEQKVTLMDRVRGWVLEE